MLQSIHLMHSCALVSTRPALVPRLRPRPARPKRPRRCAAPLGARRAARRGLPARRGACRAPRPLIPVGGRVRLGKGAAGAAGLGPRVWTAAVAFWASSEAAAGPARADISRMTTPEVFLRRRRAERGEAGGRGGMMGRGDEGRGCAPQPVLCGPAIPSAVARRSDL